MPKKNNKNKPIDRTELVWPGKRKEVERVELPFQTIETINLPRGMRQDELFGESGQEGWKNRLIWGDNLLIMGSLLKEFAGKINLIYIDPPFATGDDFSFEVRIGDQEITKEPSALEVKAYRDTWGKGMQSYLQMMYDRLVLMKELLADNGSIYVHLDWRMSSYIRQILDEIFGEGNFQNEIYWKRTTARAGSEYYNNIVDNILFYTKSERAKWNQQYTDYSEEYIETMFRGVEKNGRRYRESPLTAPGRSGGRSGEVWRGIDPSKVGKGRHWAIPGYVLKELSDKAKKDTILALGELDKLGRLTWSSNKMPNIKQYQDELKGVELQNIWLDIGIAKGEYPTQKPQPLLERIIQSSSDEGDIVADFFCGSGTTGVVAEKLGRKWVMSDLGRFAIHTSRKRLLDMSAKPFVVQNLGKYERHRWVQLNGRYANYLKFILELYHAEPVKGFTNLHGKKDKTFVHIGAVDAPVTLSEIREALSECKENKIKSLDVLGWEWEMGLHELIKEEAERHSVKLGTFQIPREVMELNVSDPKVKKDIHFYELAYLEVEPKVEGKRATITLKDFIIPNPELLPEEVKGKVKNWSDFIDYWAVDWMFNQHEEETDEDDTFHNMNQRYRTRKEPKLELSMDYDYKKHAPRSDAGSGKYNVLVKVIDIFGNDATKLIEIKV